MLIVDDLREVINDNPGVYLKYNYLTFPVNLNIVPEVIVEGDTFFSKSSYHVSLLCLEGMSKPDQIKILAFAQKFRLKLGKVTSVFRLVKEGGQRTIIVRVNFFGLKKLIMGIHNSLGYHFEYPPTHVTLFTLKGQTGIGINTFERYRQVGHQIIPSDIKRLKRSFKFI